MTPLPFFPGHDATTPPSNSPFQEKQFFHSEEHGPSQGDSFPEDKEKEVSPEPRDNAVTLETNGAVLEEHQPTEGLFLKEKTPPQNSPLSGKNMKASKKRQPERNPEEEQIQIISFLQEEAPKETPICNQPLSPEIPRGDIVTNETNSPFRKDSAPKKARIKIVQKKTGRLS